MKRATGFAAVLMAAAMVFTMAGCGSSKDADTSAKKETKTEDSKDKENSDKQFIVGFDAEYPPYGYKDDNGEYAKLLGLAPNPHLRANMARCQHVALLLVFITLTLSTACFLSRVRCSPSECQCSL